MLFGAVCSLLQGHSPEALLSYCVRRRTFKRLSSAVPGNHHSTIDILSFAKRFIQRNGVQDHSVV